MSRALLIFDFDGVLVDSEILSNEIWSDALTRAGYPIDAAECGRRFVGVKARDVRAQVERDLGNPLPPDFESTIRKEGRRRLATELQAVRGAAQMLEAVPGHRCIASNSGHEWIALGLRATGLHAHFAAETVFSAAEVAAGKPAPDLFLHAAGRMGAEPERCVVIEDSLPGVRAAVAADMTVLGFTGASHVEAGHAAALRREGAQLVFDDLAELPALLRDF